jgi:hypothetical protein
MLLFPMRTSAVSTGVSLFLRNSSRTQKEKNEKVSPAFLGSEAFLLPGQPEQEDVSKPPTTMEMIPIDLLAEMLKFL